MAGAFDFDFAAGVLFGVGADFVFCVVCTAVFNEDNSSSGPDALAAMGRTVAVGFDPPVAAFVFFVAAFVAFDPVDVFGVFAGACVFGFFGPF